MFAENGDYSINDYIEILQISSSATLFEIKKAYRRRAKQLHPDVNSSPDAQEQFCLLNEAYDFFVSTLSSNEASQINIAQNNWFSKQNISRSRSEKYAKMRYDQFINTDFYQTSTSINTLFDFVIVVLILMALIGIPLFAYAYSGIFATLFILLFIAITSKGWLSVIKAQKSAFQIHEVKGAVLHLSKKGMSYLIIGTLVNFLVLIHTFSFTFLSLPKLFGIYITAVLLGYLFSMAVQNKMVKTLLRWVIFPSIISLFFVLNFSLSSNRYQEIYSFQHHIDKIGKTQHTTSLLIFENNKYKQFPGIRFIFNDENSSISRYIKMTIEDGFFGLPVLKEYSFTWSDPRKVIKFK